MSTQRPKVLTYRVERIPSGTTKAELIATYFDPGDQNDLEVKSLFPNHESVEGCNDEDLTATVVFRPRSPRPDGPRIRSLEIDRDFVGFTPLYVPPKGKGPIVADIVAVTGLAGHAFGSWAHDDHRMWLRDYLPKYADNARILTYGYPSELSHNQSVSILQDYVTEFIQRLMYMREVAQCESRPIILVGHSLGCLIIKKTIVEVGTEGIFGLRFPIRTVVFLAAPHRGLDITALRELVKGQPPEMLIRELEPGSPSLRELSTRFASCVQDIDILTCYETKMTKTVVQNDQGRWERNGPPVMMVTSESAILHYPTERSFPAHSDHSQIAKLTQSQAGILSRVGKAIKDGLHSITETGVDANNERPHFGINTYQVLGTNVKKLPRPDPFEHELRPVWQERPPSSPVLHLSGSERLPNPQVPPVLVPNDTRSERSAREATPTGPSDGNFKFTDEDKPVSRCKICNKPIPNSIFHFRCRSCSDAGSEDDCFCQGCYDPRSLCDKHSEIRSKTSVKSRFGFHHYVDYLDAQVFDSENVVVKAIQKNDLDELRLAVKDERLVNARDTRGCTPLHLAALLGHAECIRVLLEAHARREVRSSAKDTPLILAVNHDKVQAVEVLLEHNVNVNSIGGRSYASALYYAAKNGQSDIVAMLLEHDAETELKNEESQTALYVAARTGDVRSISLLLEAGAEPNVKDTDGGTPLHIAAAKGHTNLIELLLSNGADLDNLNKAARTPLHVAVKAGKPAAVKILIAAEANLDTRDRSGNSLLHTAAASDFTNLVRLLVEHKAAIESKNTNGYTPLLSAALKGRVITCMQLLDAGADVHAVSLKDGRDVLMLASSCDAPKVIKLMLSHGAAVDRRDHENYTALHHAAMRGAHKSCRALLGANASPHLSGGPGSSNWEGGPRLIAMRKLIIGGPGPDSLLETPMQLAVKKGHVEVVEVLLEHGVSPDCTFPDGTFPLLEAAKNGSTPICQVLINNRADLDRETWRAYSTVSTAVVTAASHGHLETLKCLLDNEASGRPPSRLKGKWKNLGFHYEVSGASRAEILRMLRAAKHA